MITADQACDYLITRALAAEPTRYLSVVKLQWLLYRSQCGYLASHQGKLFDGAFEAWVEGPVNREIRHRFKPAKLMYSAVQLADRQADFQVESIPADARTVMEGVLEAYGQKSDAQLEILVQGDGPWLRARGDLSPGEACRNLIDEEAMRAEGTSAGGMQPSIEPPAASPGAAAPLDVISDLLGIERGPDVPPDGAIELPGVGRVPTHGIRFDAARRPPHRGSPRSRLRGSPGSDRPRPG